MKKITSILTATGLILFSQSFAYAQVVNVCPQGSGLFTSLCNFKSGEFGKILGTAITFIFVIAVVIALAFLVFGGIKWITSGGDKTNVEGARNMIVAAIVGIIVVFLSYFVLNLILGFFNLSLGALELPHL